MAITILMILYVLLAVGIGSYLIAHRTRAFLVFHPESTPTLSRVLTIFGCLLIVLGLVAILALISQNVVFMSMTLLAGVVIIVAMQLILVHWLPKA